MKHEIERKFLVMNDDWRAGVTRMVRLRDGLVATFGAGKVRVRVALGAAGPARAWVGLKGPRQGITRTEYEYEVPVAEAESMLAEFCPGRIVEKTRHLVPHAGLVWEVDVYDGFLAGVTYAEVELDHPGQTVVLPPWIGREVTGQPQHSKRALVAAAQQAAFGRLAT
ncbi:CYTH domain-containing protein [Roseomonas sp. CAU 1739]|uniref:CYTH domain-containing protein n=1 Tax=Roseomonas sp. CAU 1739 TaxID=3140364 RepID=UPI00325B9423